MMKDDGVTGGVADHGRRLEALRKTADRLGFRPQALPRKPFDPNDASDSDHVRAKTVVTAISRITERPLGKEACLVVIYGDELGKKYNLNTPSVVVGRSSKCEIQIDQESISRNHSKIVNTGKSIQVRDLGSTNGTSRTPTTRRSIASPPWMG
jgi:FHA domain